MHFHFIFYLFDLYIRFVHIHFFYLFDFYYIGSALMMSRPVQTQTILFTLHLYIDFHDDVSIAKGKINS